MRGFGEILTRIEDGVRNAQQQWHDEKQASRINPIALATVLVSIITVLVGGSWVIGSELARHEERSQYQQYLINQVETRQWGETQHGGTSGLPPPVPSHQ